MELPASSYSYSMAHEEDDMAVNGRIPGVGDRLSVVGISFEVIVV